MLPLLQTHRQHSRVGRLRKACQTTPRSNAGYTSRGVISAQLHRISPPSQMRKSSRSDPSLLPPSWPPPQNHLLQTVLAVCPPTITHYGSPISPLAVQSESYLIRSRMRRYSNSEGRHRRSNELRRRVPHQSLMEHRPMSSRSHRASLSYRHTLDLFMATNLSRHGPLLHMEPRWSMGPRR
jgi:hypothetical protein